MSDSDHALYLDTNILINLAKIGLSSGRDSFYLDSLFSLGRQIYVTDAVEFEAVGKPFPEVPIIKAWLLRNHNRVDQPETGTPVGKNAGITVALHSHVPFQGFR
ncbi:MAG: hypothetical protein GY742_04525 [Hyphomicrobiales bacterium]|nr:hypothetical protein [Hyphomicrobiales bacterium]